VEARYGLTVTAASDRTAAKRATYAESEKATRRGLREPVRDTLRRSVRTAVAGASGLEEFLERLREDGVLVRERFSERNPGQITGYAVALPDGVDAAGKPIYFGGGGLAADLTLPKLRRRWDLDIGGPDAESAGGGHGAEAESPRPGGPTPPAPGGTGEHLGEEDRHRLTPGERQRIWEQAAAAASRAAEHIHASPGSDPEGAADAAWAASDFLAAAARVVECRRGGPLTVAAAEYDRAARALWGRVPAPSAAGRGLRTTGVLLASARFVGRSETRQFLALLAQLTALGDAVTRLRESQHRAAQAAAARLAAEQLRLTTAQHGGDHGAAPASASARVRRPATSPDLGWTASHAGPPSGPGAGRDAEEASSSAPEEAMSRSRTGGRGHGAPRTLPRTISPAVTCWRPR
jgi:hypothetical protein